MVKLRESEHRRAVSLALIHDIGDPEFIDLCKKQFHERKAMMIKTSKRDPEVSKRNLKALDDYKNGKTKTLKLEFVI